MSLIHIPELLSQDDLELIDALFEKSEFVDGSKTASLAAKAVKNNLQIDVNDSKTLPEMQNIITAVLQNNPLFQISALPRHIHPLLFSKYYEGMTYGWHVDSPSMGNPAIRTDLAMTIFLSAPDTYDGGELLIHGAQGITAYKPAKGDAVVYPCMYLHCVNPITKGERRAAVTWIQSIVASDDKRQILFNLNQIHGMLYHKDAASHESNLLLQTYSNLLRMWFLE